MRAFQRSAICISVCQRVAKLLMIEVFEARFLEILGNESLLIWILHSIWTFSFAGLWTIKVLIVSTILERSEVQGVQTSDKSNLLTLLP